MSDTPPTLGGVFAAVLTPLDAALAPDHAALARHCRWLLANGCDGLAVLGTTGEANAFSVDERLAILEGLAEAGIPAGALLPGTGCCAVPDTVALTRRALELGAAGVLMLPPFYYKKVSDDGLFAAYSEVIERVGDARLRVYRLRPKPFRDLQSWLLEVEAFWTDQLGAFRVHAERKAKRR